MAGDAKDRRAGSDPALNVKERRLPSRRSLSCNQNVAVQRNRPVRRAAVLVIAHFSTIEIEIPVWLVTNLTGERHNRRNLPVKAGSGPNLAVRHHCMVEAWNPMRIAKRVVGSESRLGDGCSCIE